MSEDSSVVLLKAFSIRAQSPLKKSPKTLVKNSEMAVKNASIVTPMCSEETTPQ